MGLIQKILGLYSRATAPSTLDPEIFPMIALTTGVLAGGAYVVWRKVRVDPELNAVRHPAAAANMQHTPPYLGSAVQVEMADGKPQARLIPPPFMVDKMTQGGKGHMTQPRKNAK